MSSRDLRRVLALAVAIALGPGCPRPPVAPAGAADGRSIPGSNLDRGDYAGSGACARCHPEIHRAWQGSPMRNMTRRIQDVTPATPFDGRTFVYRGDRATLETVLGVRYLQLASKFTGNGRFRITKIIGGRTREDLVGEAVDDLGHRLPGEAGLERVMPVSWLLGRQEPRYKGYSVMTPDRPGMKPGAVWRRTCIFCHNTPHYLATLYDDLLGPGAPTYQGRVANHLLPRERTWGLRVIDPARAQDALTAELGRLEGRRGLPPPDGLRPLLRRLSHVTERAYREQDLVELGIGCEACHGGSREHVRNPSRRPTFAPRSRFLQATPPLALGQPGRAAWINRTCRRCHTVLFSGYPHTWEAGRVDRHPGGSHINSGEARNLLLGGAGDQIACTACHDPHRRQDPAAMKALGTPAGNRVCLPCHETLRDPATLSRHTHHRAGGPGTACLGCHMPRKVMTLTVGLGRYHRIGRPNAVVKVEGDRPIECAQCHPDRSVAFLVDRLEAFWGRRYDRAALARLYGPDPGVRPLHASLTRGLPHEVAVAAVRLGEARDRTAVPSLVAQLANPIPLVRFFVRSALEAILSRRLALDMTLPGDALARQARSAIGLPP